MYIIITVFKQSKYICSTVVPIMDVISQIIMNPKAIILIFYVFTKRKMAPPKAGMMLIANIMPILVTKVQNSEVAKYE